jgi:hypothetical protein
MSRFINRLEIPVSKKTTAPNRGTSPSTSSSTSSSTLASTSLDAAPDTSFVKVQLNLVEIRLLSRSLRMLHENNSKAYLDALDAIADVKDVTFTKGDFGIETIEDLMSRLNVIIRDAPKLT